MTVGGLLVRHLGPLAVAAMLASAPTAANVTPNYDNARTDRWRCRLCPFEDAARHDGRLAIGAISVQEAQPRFGRDNGLDDDGVQVDLAADHRQQRSDGRMFSFAGDNLGLDSRNARIEFLDPPRGGLVVEWREIPRNVATDGRTPYAGRNTLTLPSAWVAAFDTAHMTALEDASRQFDHATHRRKASVRMDLRPRPRWRVAADYAREARSGTTETHADLLYQTVGLPKPIDHGTEELQAGVRFEGGSFLFGTDVRESRFRNGDRGLEWENPYAWGPRLGRKGLAPGNDARSLSVVSRWNPRRRTTLHGRLDWGWLHQDQSFLPYSSNPAVAVEPLPATSLDGRTNTFGGTLNLVSRLTERLRLGIAHRRRERENDTPALLLTPVLGDLFATAPRESRIHAFDRTKTALRLQYRLTHRVRLAAGAQERRVNRAAAEIVRNDERARWLEVLGTNLRGFRLSARFAKADRDASASRDVTANNPLTRRFHQAARRQRAWRGKIDYFWASVGLSVGLQADHRWNHYPNSPLGLRRDHDRGWGADFSYAPNATFTLSGFRTAREAGSRTAGSHAFAAADWWYGTRDTVRTTGLTLQARELANARVDVSLTYAHSRGLGRYDTLVQDAPSVFPVLVSEHRSVDIQVRFRWNARMTLTTRYYLEDYGAADWALQGVGQAAARNLMSLGRGTPDYGNGLLSVSVETRL